MISHFWNFCRACPALEADKVMHRYFFYKFLSYEKFCEIGACQTHFQDSHAIILRQVSEMILHFWNYCRACPALEAEKVLHRYFFYKIILYEKVVKSEHVRLIFKILMKLLLDK